MFLHVNGESRYMKTAPPSLIFHWKFSKFSVVSNLSFWLYSSEQKPRNTGNFWIFENFEFCLSSSQRIYLNLSYKWLRIWIPHKTQRNYFTQTTSPSDVHCFLLKKYLSRWNFFKIFHLSDEFRSMKIASHSLICHWNEVF